MPDPEYQRLIEVIKKKDLKIKQLEQQITEYKIKIKELNDQKERELEETKKEIEELKKKKDQFDKEIIILKNDIEELKKELKSKDARMDSLENTIKENEKSHRKEMEEMKDIYKTDMRELECRDAKRRQEIEECLEAFKWNDDENQELKAENKELKSMLKDNKKIIHDRDKLYIGQLCMELPTNLYRYVMPEHCCAKDIYYKIKDIENDVDNEDLLNDEERQEAGKRFEILKKKLDWKKLKNLKGAIRLLQDTRNQVAHPPVNDKEAMHAARRLNEKGKLKGKTSFERVTQIIRMYSVSKSLLVDQNCNYAD